MNPLKSEDSTAGIKIRRWQGDPPCEGLSNSSHAFETPLDHDGTPSPSDESAQDLQSTSDNGIPRSHSQELQSENHYEKGLLKTEKTSNLGECNYHLYFIALRIFPMNNCQLVKLTD